MFPLDTAAPAVTPVPEAGGAESPVPCTMEVHRFLVRSKSPCPYARSCCGSRCLAGSLMPCCSVFKVHDQQGQPLAGKEDKAVAFGVVRDFLSGFGHRRRSRQQGSGAKGIPGSQRLLGGGSAASSLSPGGTRGPDAHLGAPRGTLGRKSLTAEV